MHHQSSNAAIAVSDLDRVSFTGFLSDTHPHGLTFSASVADFIGWFRTPRFSSDTPKRGLHMYSLATFDYGYRCGGFLQGIASVGFDVDVDPVPTIDNLLAATKAWRGFIHSSSSHLLVCDCNPKGTARWRVVLLLSRLVSPPEYRRIHRALARRFSFNVGEAAKDPSRGWYVPRASPAYVFEELKGEPIDVEAMLEEEDQLPSDLEAADDDLEDVDAAEPLADAALEEVATLLAPAFVEGQTNDLRFAIAGVCKSSGRPQTQALELLVRTEEKGTHAEKKPHACPKAVEQAYGGSKRVYGWPKLRELVGDDSIVDRVSAILDGFDFELPEDLFSEIGKPANDDACLSALRVRSEADDRLSLAERVAALKVESWHFDRGDAVEIARSIIDVVSTHHQIEHTEGAFYAYDPARGVWDSEGVEGALRSAIYSMAGATLPGATRVSKHTGETIQTHRRLNLKAHDVRGALETLAHMRADEKFFASTVDGLACPNGFLRLTDEGVELRSHSPEHRARTAYPIEYDPDARSERWETFLADLFRDDADAAEKIALLGEFFGGALFGLSTTYQKCIAAPGEGSNGKSTLLSIMDDVFPAGTLAAYSPQKLENEYWRAKLPGVLLNAVSELPSAAILASEAFKAIVTGDRIDAREPTKPVISFRPKAGHFFGGNSLPSTTDQSHGFWRRFIVLGFNRVFGADADKHVVKKILAECRPAILSWLVEGAVRLRRQGEYTVPPSHDALIKSWRQNSDSVALWFEERIQADPSAKTAARDLYGAYAAWAKASGLKPVAINTWGVRLGKMGHRREGKEKAYALTVPSGDVPLFIR